MEKENKLIEAYLLGELTAAEKAGFEEAMQSDAALAQSVEAYRRMQHQLWGMQLRQKVEAVVAETRPLHTVTNRRKWLFPVLIILSGVFFCFLYFKRTPLTMDRPKEQPSPVKQDTPIIENTSTEPVATIPQSAPASKNTSQAHRYSALAQAFYQPPGSDFIRSTDDTTPALTTIQEAKDAFFAQNYPLTVHLLRHDSEWTDDESVRFLRACARFKTEDYTGAKQDFQRLENSFQYRYEARWHLVLCMVAQGTIGQPRNRALLEAMAADADFPYQEQAKALKSQL